MLESSSGDKAPLDVSAIVVQLSEHEPRTPEEQALVCAAKIVQLSWDTASLLPLNEVFVAQIGQERGATLDLIQRARTSEVLRAQPITSLLDQVEISLLQRAVSLRTSWATLSRMMGMSPQGVAKRVQKKQNYII